MRSPLASSRWVLAAMAFVAPGCASRVAGPILTAETIPPATTIVETTTTPTTTVDAAIAPDPLRGNIQFEVVGTYPHDVDAFTQGLEFVGGDLYESTGLRGESDLRITDPITGMVEREVALNPSFFGEGMTERDGLIYHLTYTAGLLLIADAEDLEPAGTAISYEGEGWGLCTTSFESDRPFVMSNGTPELTIRDPLTFDVRQILPVIAEDGSPLQQINELECVGSHVLANVWQTDEIVSIDLATGQVEGRLNLAELVPEGVEPVNSVLNGIAYQPMTGTYFVTGKRWPVMYELKLTSG